MISGPESRIQTNLATVLLLAMMLLPGCQTLAQSDPDVADNHETIADEAPSGKQLSAREQIDFSKQNLAERLGIPVDEIEISGATPVMWRSGAMGCPKPGMSYTQALVPGIWLLLKANGNLYRYHATPQGQPFYCPEELAESPATGPSDI